ncbi:antitoxin Xre/MbcA/ParS toxin-binding domain-containing protein [Dyella flava]|uniref:DUF2384 domain-containing protein n=1 Tax=Dyella flava TaxID=1920170 RepID=A0ABS2K465_9GAMM|nr:antitoxin Xre/MbcA/ParS toxin-binding domain-containing protein [Dyella flava]MBM7125996.1 DUF2384 domain-containing protein [Dyella flava]GLQ50919.1 hypothetical protein GCM10010872_23680 [Dyella flava]
MHRDILADHPEFAATPGIVENIERVVAAAEAVSGNHDGALEWLTKASLATFDGKTPLAVIGDGRTDDLLHYLASIESGYVG